VTRVSLWVTVGVTRGNQASQCFLLGIRLHLVLVFLNDLCARRVELRRTDLQRSKVTRVSPLCWYGCGRDTWQCIEHDKKICPSYRHAYEVH